MKLVFQQVAMGRRKAEKYIQNVCKELGIKLPTQKIDKLVLEIDIGKKIRIVFDDELNYLMKNGKANVLQKIYDNSDLYLASTIGIGVYDLPKGLQIELTSEYENVTHKISGPGYIESPEISFTDDITCFREEFVRFHNEHQYMEMNRMYRSYLLSTMTVIDCFLHRYSLKILNRIENANEFDNIRKLSSLYPVESRIESWIETFCIHKMQEIKESKEWCNFKELKKRRNDFVHPKSTDLRYDVEEMVHDLNLAKYAVGGLLYRLREYSEQKIYIGFIQQLRNMKEISIEEDAI